MRGANATAAFVDEHAGESQATSTTARSRVASFSPAAYGYPAQIVRFTCI